MPLTLVLGPANSAKARAVLSAYTAAARRGALLVVPTAADAIHYDRELADNASSGLTLGRAITFPGLIDEIAQRLGFDGRRVTPLQRERVLRRAIASQSLPSIGESASAPGFARAAGHLISELQQRRVAPRRFTTALRSWAEGVPDRLGYAVDLASIYRGYTQSMEASGLLDAETFAWGVLDLLRERPDRWPRTAIYLYGFDDFTAIEMDTIETFVRQVGVQVTVSLTYEPGRPALAARATVVEDLRELAQIVTELPALDEYYEPAARAALHHLERNLFERDPPSVDPGSAVELLEAGGERAEAELIAAEVLAALHEGVEPDEIVVVCRSLARSGALLEGTLRRYGVPAASTRTVPLGHTALGGAVLAMARCALLEGDQATVADLLLCLRAPGVHPHPLEVDQLEVELRRAGIVKLRELTDPLQRQLAHPALQAISELRGARDPAAVLAELTRALFVVPHVGSAPLLSDAEQLDARAATAILTALAELSELDGARRGRTQPDELIEALQSVEVAAGAPPAHGDVLVAEPLAIRARRFRRVIVCGLCEGEFPSPGARSADPFLPDDRRREVAAASGLALPIEPDPLARERYLLYACVSRATERVTFSYRSADEDGNVVMPSVFLADIAELFAPDWRERRRRRLLSDVVWSPQEAPTERERRLALRAASAGASVPQPATLTLGAQPLAHVRHSHVVSAGALETFAACPVKWLIERQLDARDLDPDPDPLARGSFMHAVLERVVASLNGPLRPATLGEADQALKTAIASTPNRIGHGQAPEVRAAILRGIEADLRRYLHHEAAEDHGWIPMRMELRFGTGDSALPAVRLGPAEEELMLSGVIDRVDVEPGAGRRAIVRDYKSGAKQDTWPSARWVSDDQLQVGLYMLAVRRLLGLEAVAGFYQPLTGEDLRARGVFTEAAEIGEAGVFKDELTPAELDELLAEIEEQALAIAGELRSGQLTPCPERCSSAGGCRHPGLCWAP